MSEFQTIVITRALNAPRKLVFEAWLDAKHLLHWYYASEDWTTPFAESDPRVGGKIRIGFASPDGKNDFVLEGAYNEIVPHERIVFTLADGRPITVTLADKDGKTELTLVLSLETLNSSEQQREGWTLMLVHLENYLNTL